MRANDRVCDLNAHAPKIMFASLPRIRLVPILPTKSNVFLSINFYYFLFCTKRLFSLELKSILPSLFMNSNNGRLSGMRNVDDTCPFVQIVASARRPNVYESIKENA